MVENAICFACGTEFHLLVAYMLSTTVYSPRKKMLFLLKDPRIMDYLDVVHEINLWDEIVIFDPLLDYEVIDEQIQKWVPFIDTLHYFSIGYQAYNVLFRRVCEQGKKIILTDEGMGSYLPFKRFGAWMERSPGSIFFKGVDLSKADEIWLLNPKLYIDQDIIPKKQIDIEWFYKCCHENPQLVKDFKKIFRTREHISLDYDFIYFRQYFSLVGFLSEEADIFFDSIICNLLKKYRSAVKDHPAYTKNPYSINLETLPLQIPWEALIILSKIDDTFKVIFPQVYISATSSALIATNSLGISGDFIFINRLLENYSNFIDATIKDFVNICRIVFPNSCFYQPENLEEFINILSKIAERSGYLPPDVSIDDIRKIESNWLLDQYKNHWQKSIEDKRKITELERGFYDLKGIVEEKENVIDQLEAKIFIQTQTVKDLEVKIQTQNEVITDYAISTSWKVTRPFRKLRKLLGGK